MNINKKTLKILKKALFHPNNKLALIPNWLSFSRAIGSYVIPILIYSSAPITTIFSVIFFIALSDFFDGKIARLLKVQSKEGALIDAISDKLFSINLILFILPKAPFFIINGVLESIISYINTKLYSKGAKPKSNLLGKIKIWPLSAALGLGYLNIAINNQNINIINPNIIMTTSILLSTITIPFEIINIKQYKEEGEKEILKSKSNNNIIDKKKAIKKYQKKGQKITKNNINIDKNKKIKAIVFELEKEKNNSKPKQKRL